MKNGYKFYSVESLCKFTSTRSRIDLLNFLLNNDFKYFNPHPFTLAYINRICRTVHSDLYCLYYQCDGKYKTLVGYGMLRGFDDGYTIPSLGIAIDKDYRNLGIGYEIMSFLHDYARKIGCKKIMLRVHPDNTSAINLYKKFNYEFEQDGELLKGYANL